MLPGLSRPCTHPPRGRCVHSRVPYIALFPRGAVRAARLAAAFGAVALLVNPVAAAPYRPASDDQVLERLPERNRGAASAALRELRARQAADPRDPVAAAALARAYFEQVAAEGDPRYIGYAQAALAPWWDQPAAPADVRVARALLRQFNHDFDGALADLRAVTAADPARGDAWAWLAAIAMVQARYDDARAACAALQPQAPVLVVTACRAAADALSGRATPAADALRAALAADPGADPAQRLWALTRLAEIDERRGDFVAAEAAYKAAMALGIADGYLQSAYADFLLDRGRPAEVLALLKGGERSDLLLLRLALAAKAAGAPEAAKWQADLAARFDAARRRGDATHEKEESRFLLAFGGDAARALELARHNFTVQREPADARALLEAALAARAPEAAKPVLDWMAANRVESVALQALAQRLGGAK